jgi:hypothetical protein
MSTSGAAQSKSCPRGNLPLHSLFNRLGHSVSISNIRAFSPYDTDSCLDDVNLVEGMPVGIQLPLVLHNQSLAREVIFPCIACSIALATATHFSSISNIRAFSPYDTDSCLDDVNLVEGMPVGIQVVGTIIPRDMGEPLFIRNILRPRGGRHRDC